MVGGTGGYAIGRSDIQADALHFRFYEEVFTVRDRALKVKKEGDYLIAKVDEVRKLAHG